MHRPDRVGVLVISLAVFALYLGLANLLDFLGLLPLPLGNLGNEPVILVTLGDTVVMSLYLVRQSKRSQSSVTSE